MKAFTDGKKCFIEIRLQTDVSSCEWLEFRQNGAPSGLEKRGLDASIYHKTRKPTEGTQ
ncbi:hypothetical protein IQA64_15995 [Leptospira borgpetersenii serovar Tarassovi]|nr:hypothetical protein [Leptospira borgpetersenii serovar Tarassovi]